MCALPARVWRLLRRPAAQVGAHAPEVAVAASFWRAAQDKPLLSRCDFLDVRDRNDEPAIPEDAAPDEELIRPIEARAEPNRFDDTKALSGRFDPEAFAAAEPVVAIPSERSGKLQVARHAHSLLRKRHVLLSRRSRSAKLVCTNLRTARNDYFSL
jgi:hypothetical protein